MKILRNSILYVWATGIGPQPSGTTNALWGVTFSNAGVGTVVGATGMECVWKRNSSGTLNYLHGVSFADVGAGKGAVLRPAPMRRGGGVEQPPLHWRWRPNWAAENDYTRSDSMRDVEAPPNPMTLRWAKITNGHSSSLIWRYTQNLIGMTCPACTIEPSAQYSDCGHEFLPGTKPTGWTPTQISESPGCSQSH